METKREGFSQIKPQTLAKNRRAIVASNKLHAIVWESTHRDNRNEE